MATKAQHEKHYRPVAGILRSMREKGELTQRALGEKLGRPQSWVYNCECGNRRVDLGEFVEWSKACGVDPIEGVKQYLRQRH